MNSLETEHLRRRAYATHEPPRSSVFQYVEEVSDRRSLLGLPRRSESSAFGVLTGW